MAGYRVIIRNALSNWVNIGISSIIAFFMLPFLVNTLGAQVYGIWLLMMAVAGYGIFMDFGITNSIIKYVSEYGALRDEENLNKVVSTSLLMHACIGMSIFAGAFALSRYASTVFKIPAAQIHNAEVAFIILGLDMALKLPFSVFSACLNGFQRYHITNGIGILNLIVRTVLMIVFLVGGYGLVAMTVILVCTDVLGHLLVTLAAFRVIPGLKVRLKYVKMDALKKLYKFGFYGFAVVGSERIIYESSSLLIGIFLPMAAVTFYGIPNNLVRYLRQIAHGFGNVFNPAASELEATMKHDQLADLLIQGTKHTLLFVLPLTLILTLVGKEFISLWMGANYAEAGGNVLIILAVVLGVAMAQVSSSAILFGLNRHNYLAAFYSAEAIVNIGLSIVLIQKYGIIGAALGMAIPRAIVSLFLVPIYTCRVLGISLIEYIKGALLGPIRCSLGFAIILLMLDALVKAPFLGVFFIKVGVSLGIYLVVAFYWGLTINERQALLGYLGI